MEELSIVPGNSISSTMAYLRQLTKGGTIPSDATEDELQEMMIMTQEEVQTAMNAVLQKYDDMLHHPDHLYVPGRVLLLYEDYSKGLNTSKGGNTPTSCGSSSCCDGTEENITNSDDDQLKKIQTSETRTSTDAVGMDEQPIYKVIETDGSAVALRFFELDSFRFTTDHTTVSYERSMKLANLI